MSSANSIVFQFVVGLTPHDLPALASLAPVVSVDSLLASAFRPCLSRVDSAPRLDGPQDSTDAGLTTRTDDSD